MKISDSWLTKLFWVFGVCVCVCVFVCFVYLHHFYQYYCVSQEETSLIASNQQINNLQVNTF